VAAHLMVVFVARRDAYRGGSGGAYGLRGDPLQHRQDTAAGGDGDFHPDEGHPSAVGDPGPPQQLGRLVPGESQPGSHHPHRQAPGRSVVRRQDPREVHDHGPGRVHRDPVGTLEVVGPGRKYVEHMFDYVGRPVRWLRDLGRTPPHRREHPGRSRDTGRHSGDGFACVRSVFAVPAIRSGSFDSQELPVAGCRPPAHSSSSPAPTWPCTQPRHQGATGSTPTNTVRWRARLHTHARRPTSLVVGRRGRWQKFGGNVQFGVSRKLSLRNVS